jgi:hypothetical protein
MANINKLGALALYGGMLGFVVAFAYVFAR